MIEPSGLRELPVKASHAAGVARLPMHHADPFARLLLAQPRRWPNPLKLVTPDATLAPYSELVMVV